MLIASLLAAAEVGAWALAPGPIFEYLALLAVPTEATLDQEKLPIVSLGGAQFAQWGRRAGKGTTTGRKTLSWTKAASSRG